MVCESVPKLSAHTTGTAWTVAEHSKTSDHGNLTQIDVQLLSWKVIRLVLHPPIKCHHTTHMTDVTIVKDG